MKTRRPPAPARRGTAAREGLRRILCPVDFSKASELALGVAAEVAGRTGTLHLLHVRQPSYVIGGLDAMPVFIPPPNPKQESADVRRVLRRLDALGRRTVGSRGPALRTHVRTGPDAAWHILQAAQGMRVDAILLATHARRGIQRLVLGSVAKRVARGAPVPAILIHLPARRLAARRARRGAGHAPARAPRGSGRRTPRARKAAAR
jgi:nucleotide-binding universal stress UspA family protein